MVGLGQPALLGQAAPGGQQGPADQAEGPGHGDAGVVVPQRVAGAGFGQQAVEAVALGLGHLVPPGRQARCRGDLGIR